MAQKPWHPKFRRSLCSTLRVAWHFQRHLDEWEKQVASCRPHPERQEGGTHPPKGERGRSDSSPLVSIVTPCFNAATTIEKTILSVLNQGGGDVELIVIDGGSTDGTLDILRRYEDRIACWISEPDEGIYDAMNKGIDLARGEWLYFLGADDWLADEGVLDRIFRKNHDDVVMVYGKARYVDGQGGGRTVANRFSWKSRIWCTFQHQGIFYRRELFDAFRYKPMLKVVADRELNYRILTQGLPRREVNEVIACCGMSGITFDTSRHVQNIRDDFLLRSPYVPFFSNLLFFFIEWGDFWVRKLIPHRY